MHTCRPSRWFGGGNNPFELRHVGAEPLDIVLLGEALAATPPNITLGEGGRLSLVGNTISSFASCLDVNVTPGACQLSASSRTVRLLQSPFYNPAVYRTNNILPMPGIRRYCQPSTSGNNIASSLSGTEQDGYDKCVLADEATERASEQAGEAFDHLRILGEWDLFLNIMPSTAMGFF